MNKLKRLYLIARRLLFTFMDVLTQNKGVWVSVHDLKLKLPYSLSHYYPGNYEKDNFDFLNSVQLKAGYCIDVGAHLGLYSMWLAREEISVATESSLLTGMHNVSSDTGV